MSACEMLKDRINNGRIDPDLALLSILPDCPHIRKNLEASFANWGLNLSEGRGSLAVLRTLMTRADKETMKTVSHLIPRNDHLKKKGRHIVIFRLCNFVIKSLNYT